MVCAKLPIKRRAFRLDGYVANRIHISLSNYNWLRFGPFHTVEERNHKEGKARVEYDALLGTYFCFIDSYTVPNN